MTSKHLDQLATIYEHRREHRLHPLLLVAPTPTLGIITHDSGSGDAAPEDEIECPLLGGAFDIRTGQPAAFPVVVPVETYRVRVVGDEVQVAAND